MRNFNTPDISLAPFVLILVLAQLFVSGCSFNVTRYSDGPLTQYLGEPVPKIGKPIARSLSLEKIAFQTAANMKATIISDLLAREIYILPADIGLEVKKTLQLDEAYSEESTYAALNTIAKNKTQARQLNGSQTAGSVLSSSTITNSSTAQYIQRHESMAAESYRKGDYLAGDIHNSAATTSLITQQAAARTMATANFVFSYLNAMAAAGEGIIKNDFIKLRNRIEFESGAIGNQAPQGNHLSVFILQFFDAKSFQLDSRNRIIVYLVLTDKNGIAAKVLEGSDILNCEDECNLFQPKPTARVVDAMHYSPEIQQHLGTAEGTQKLMDNGFDPLNGFFDYILLQHGLEKLSRMVD